MMTMKRIFVLIAAVLTVAATSQAGSSTGSSEGNPLRIFILAGQSNMEGQAALRTLEGIGMDPKTRPLHDKLVDEAGNPRVYEDVHMVGFNGKPDDPRIIEGFNLRLWRAAS